MLNLVATRDLEAGCWWAPGLGAAVPLGTLGAGTPVVVRGVLTLAVGSPESGYPPLGLNC